MIALKQGQIEVVQASMLGSILSNLLLVMGMCFLLGGWFNMYEEGTDVGMEQAFASGTAQTTCSLLTLAAAAMIIPATVRRSCNLFIQIPLGSNNHKTHVF